MNEYADLAGRKRAQSVRPRMAPNERAKIFAPFAALKGFEESARVRERLLSPRPEIAEDRQEQLDRRLRALKRGDAVTVTCFVPEKRAGDAELGTFAAVTGRFLRLTPETISLTAGSVNLRDVLDVREKR